jgi:hypothetical protein
MKIRPPLGMNVKGIFAWGCVSRGEGSSFRAKAHAHHRKGDPYFGWICFRSTKRLPALAALIDREWDAEVVGKPNRILMHEYAHVLTPDHAHDDAWRSVMRRLRQPIPKQYSKKPRRRFVDVEDGDDLDEDPDQGGAA